MAAFAIAEGYGQNLDLALATVSNPESTPDEKADAVEAIKGAWMEGLKDLEDNDAHMACDPGASDLENPKTTLDELEAVGTCLGCCCTNGSCEGCRK